MIKIVFKSPCNYRRQFWIHKIILISPLNYWISLRPKKCGKTWQMFYFQLLLPLTPGGQITFFEPKEKDLMENLRLFELLFKERTTSSGWRFSNMKPPFWSFWGLCSKFIGELVFIHEKGNWSHQFIQSSNQLPLQPHYANNTAYGRECTDK